VYIIYFMFSHYKNSDCKKGPLDFTVSSFVWFCVDLPEVGLSTGRNM
jgi:hypothetical protein